MIDPKPWLEDLTQKLVARFGDRLLFLGFQGSYRRGEATEASDFDVVAVFDSLALEDLGEYRAIIKTMPENEKACGFVCGREELRNWPRHEIFQLIQDTEPIVGDLAALTPKTGREDIVDAMRIGASGIFHMAAHSFMYGPDADRTEILRPLFKGAFFALQLRHYLRSGEYVLKKSALLEKLAPPEDGILRIGMDWDASAKDRARDPDRYFRLLLDWSRLAMAGDGGAAT